MRRSHSFRREARAASFVLLASLVGVLSWSARAFADWPSNSSTNLAICTATNAQGSVDVVSDGRGGALFVWSDNRTGVSTDVYAQHVQANGAVDPAWSVNGNPICTASGNQAAPKALPDGAGGAYFFWTDWRRSGFGADVYAGHVLANGQVDPAWPFTGVPVCLADSTQSPQAVCSDGAGGAFVAWFDWRNGLDRDVYLHHVLPNGSLDPGWPANGLAVGVAVGDQVGARLVPDGSGGTIVAWSDTRTGVSDVYAQHVLGSGSIASGWPPEGLAVCALAGAQTAADLASDGAGGAFVVWQDSRSGTSADIYSHHLLATGVLDPDWPADGRPLCTATGDQANPRVVATLAGQAIACWMDKRGATQDVYASSVFGSGGSWPLHGRALCTAAGDQEYPSAVPDGTGGAVVCWRDKRADLGDIYAGHVLATGDADPAWPVNGSALSTASNSQQIPVALPDGAGGAIVAWTDPRWSSAYPDIYAQRMQANGQLGGAVVDVSPETALEFALDPIRPNPARNGSLRLTFTLGGESTVRIELLDIAGRRVALGTPGRLAPGSHAFDLDAPGEVPAGVYFVRVEADGDFRTSRVAILR